MYGNPCSPTWGAHQAPELGAKDPDTGQGFGPKTKILSSIPLWSGKGEPDHCCCLKDKGPGHVKEPFNVLNGEPRLKVEAWEKVDYFIFALCFSGNPLGTPGTCSSGIRPELNTNTNSK